MKPIKITGHAVLFLLLLLPGTAQPGPQAAEHTCAELVKTALLATHDLCDVTGRNQACYGHSSILALPSSPTALFEFEEAGDVTNVADIQTMRLSAMDEATEQWGVALLRLQSAAAEHNVTVLLFGDVEIENRVTGGEQTEIHVTASVLVRARESPDAKAAQVATFDPGETLVANGRLNDGSWVRVLLPDGASYGWVYGPLVISSGDDLMTLPVIDDTVADYGPMRAFYLRTGSDDALCEEAPDSGILIQTPEGVAHVSLLINEVNIEIGSTVYFQAVPGKKLTVNVVEGTAKVEAMGAKSEAKAGQRIEVPLETDAKPAGQPSPPTAYTMEEVKPLPVQLLEREIEVAEPDDGAADDETDDETVEPTAEPTEEVIPEPTAEVTAEPTEEVIPEPTAEVIPDPTVEVIGDPTAEASPEPTAEITVEPTEAITPELTEEITTEAPPVEITAEATRDISVELPVTTPIPTEELIPTPE